jgi:hypothetical protein
MARFRFPSNVQQDNRPYVLFSTHKAQYNTFGSKTDMVPTSNSVALYLPANYSVNDILRYETESTGAIGFTFERMTSDGGLTADDLLSIGEAVAVDQATKIAGGLAVGLGSLSGPLGALSGGVVSTGVVGNVKSEMLKSYQKTLNPREFMLFKAPGIRQFSFNFTFIPSNDEELRSVPEIIKFFRSASYPSLHAGGIQYNFPEAFNIGFGNSDKLIKIPEVVCIGTSVTYNPNSMSYYKQDNLPVEITLQLSFQELQPISKEIVEAGY